MRLFFGIAVPDELQNEIHRKLGPSRRRYPDLKWVKRENYHVTLLFVGEVDEGRLEDVKCAPGTIEGAVRPFEASLGSLGQFPPKGRARVLYVGLDRGGAEVTRLFELISSRMRAFIQDPGRRFTPHVTVARARGRGSGSGRGRGPAAADDVPEFEGGFMVERVTLYESILRPAGAEYRPVAEYPLS